MFTPRLALVLCVLVPGAALAQEFVPQFLPEMTVSRAPGAIEIDGKLDDAGWRQAARAIGFVETRPGDQTKPPVESEAWVTYDDANLYVALIAYDDPNDIRVSVSDRDEIYQDDYFGVMLDTYGDQTWGYELFVNPIGIQGDFRIVSNGGEDESFDIVWHSDGRVTETGYQVEIAIPFQSLRFPKGDAQTWRINFWRNHPREVRRRYSWAAQNRDNPCFLCQWGTLHGLESVTPGRSLEAIAAAVGSQSGERASSDEPVPPFEVGDPDAEASLNLKYGITTSSAAELTINPDFSQIESDAGVIDVNTTFAIFFPERRPFFQEGSDLYGTWVDAIYTRSINAPQVAGKLTAQVSKTSAVYLFAKDELSPLIVPLEERSVGIAMDVSYSNIARVRQSLWQDSHIGALFTDRRWQGGGGGSVAGLDGTLRFLQNYRLEFQATGSHTDEPFDLDRTDDDGTFDDGRYTVALDGEQYSGHAVYASLERSARVYNADFDYWEYSPTFRTDNGFTTRNNYRQTSFWNGLHFRPNKGWLIEWEPSVGVGRVWDTQNRFKDEWFRPNLWIEVPGQTDLSVQYLVSKERFGPETFPGIRIWSVDVDTRFSEALGGGVYANWGQGIYRDLDDPELADQRNLSAYVRLKATRRLQLEVDADYARMDSRERDEKLFEGYIVRNRLTYNFTRKFFMRMIVQYNDFSERFDVEPLVTYRVNPFTVFYVGLTSQYEQFENGGTGQPINMEWMESSRQFFFKIQYLFQM
jgi:hypothetical protein